MDHQIDRHHSAQQPRHVAIIMDGNGRWARAKGLPRIRGHEAGAKTVREIVTHAAKLKLEVLTLYSFSTENWKRPREEVEFLMELYAHYLIAERETIMSNDVRFIHVGKREGLPAGVLKEMDTTVELSRANQGLRLCLALNYGSRDEIVEGVKAIACRIQKGMLRPDEINESEITRSLYTAGLPDPDLLIRTAGERRISNFLLWQISYAELHISEKLWPDFSPSDFELALDDYRGRKRRFGDIEKG